MQSHSLHAAPLTSEELRHLQRRSNARGLIRLAGHLAACVGTAAIYGSLLTRGAHWLLVGLAATAYGFTLVTMFAPMHESVHRTAFRTPWLNDSVAWLAGLLSFYNGTFFRHYHAAHHRFTQIRGKDPERDDREPTGRGSYLLVLSGAPWWAGKLRSYYRLARADLAPYAFLNAKTGAAVVRSVRLQLATYAAGIALSIALGAPYFVLYWLLPVALAQPLLRAILLCEHTGCSEDDDAYRNTRTTHTVLPVRFLMWQMPFHAEHHAYPALPFFVLADVHERLAPHLRHIGAKGYSGVHRELLRSLRAASSQPTA